jgi:Tol biopolymer transport system component
VTFHSQASNLVPNDTNGVADVFVKTLATGAIQRVSTDSAGQQAQPGFSDDVVPDGSYWPEFSPDGTRVAFVSWATNLVPGDSNHEQDLFVKDLNSGAIQRVNTDSAGTQAEFAPMFGFSWSPDGTRIAYGDLGPSNAPFGGGGGLVVKNLTTGERIRVLAPAPQGSSFASAMWSPDGTRIAFSTTTSLLPGETFGYGGVYVVPSAGGAVQEVSRTADGADNDHVAGFPVWSPDSTRIAFSSIADNLVPGDTNGDGCGCLVEDVFVKTLASGAIERVSTASAGEEANGMSVKPAWSPDGTRIAFFSNATNLVSGDTNKSPDVFVKSLTTGVVQRVNTAYDGQQAELPSGADENWLGVRWSGDPTRVVFSTSAKNLVTDDTNGVSDVFVKVVS